MGEELEFGQLFYRTDDGQLIPFEGFKPADIVICDDMDMETYVSLPREGTIEFSLSVNMKKNRSFRKWCKELKRESNRRMRRIRYVKRLMEYARRRALKQARYI